MCRAEAPILALRGDRNAGFMDQKSNSKDGSRKEVGELESS